MYINVLITGASRKVGLIRAFREALEGGKGPSGIIVGVEMDAMSSGLYFCDRTYLVPAANDADYVPKLMDICRQEQVKLIVPTTDIELVVLAPLKGMFARKGVTLLVSNPAAINICHDKYLTYLFLKEAGLPTPVTYLPEDHRLKKPQFPLFVKPRDGRGSMDCFKVNNSKELDFFAEYVPNAVIQEYMPGREYTIDVLADFRGEVVSVVPRERVATATGVSQKGITVRDPELTDLAINVTRELGLIGPVNIQCFKTPAGPRVLEINPRFAGGYPLTHAAGVSHPKMLFKMLSGENIRASFDSFAEGMVMLRYDEAVFLSGEELIVPE